MRPNLTVLRSAIGPMLTETGIVERPGEGWVYDPVIREDVQAKETIYSGRMLIAPRGNATATEEVGGRTDHVEQYDVTLPAETDAKVGDLVKLTAAPTDPSFLDVEFTLTSVDLDPWAVARFCRAERRT